MTTITTAVLAYLIGCLNTGYFLVRISTGADLRQLGSGTLGARNTGRVLGRKGFILALAGDALKGAVAVAVAAWVDPVLVTPAAIAVVLGHVLPAPLGFRGGKGLATMLGATAVLAPWVAAVGLVTTLVVLGLTRRSGWSALAGVVAAPVVGVLLGLPAAEAVALGAMAAIVLARHAPPVVARFAPPAHREAK